MSVHYKGDDEADYIVAEPAPPGTEIYVYGYRGDDHLELPSLAWGQVYGGSGNDTLTGGGQMATLYHGGTGNDTIILGETSGGAQLHGDGGRDYLCNGVLVGTQRYFGAILDGGAGADTMVGTMRDEIFVVSSRGDVIEDHVRNDSDKVETYISYRLGSNLEDLELEGSEDLRGLGNRLDNYMTGNWASNSLVGSAGDDTLLGGGGTDRLMGGAGRDVLYSNHRDDVTIFQFDSVRDSSVEHGVDNIRRFDDNDLIDLSRIDADGLAANGDDAFVYIGDADFDADATGQLRYEMQDAYTFIVHASIDPDADAELIIRVFRTTDFSIDASFSL